MLCGPEQILIDFQLDSNPTDREVSKRNWEKSVLQWKAQVKRVTIPKPILLDDPMLIDLDTDRLKGFIDVSCSELSTCRYSGAQFVRQQLL